MVYDQDRNTGLKVHFNTIESDFINADEGDRDYQLTLISPINRYKHEHSEPDVQHIPKLKLKKIGKIARNRAKKARETVRK